MMNLMIGAAPTELRASDPPSPPPPTAYKYTHTLVYIRCMTRNSMADSRIAAASRTIPRRRPLLLQTMYKTYPSWETTTRQAFSVLLFHTLALSGTEIVKNTFQQRELLPRLVAGKWQECDDKNNVYRRHAKRGDFPLVLGVGSVAYTMQLPSLGRTIASSVV